MERETYLAGAKVRDVVDRELHVVDERLSVRRVNQKTSPESGLDCLIYWEDNVPGGCEGSGRC